MALATSRQHRALQAASILAWALLVSVAAASSTNPPTKPADEAAFKEAFANYEAGLAELCTTGSPAERGAAIQGLALVDSQRYPAVRDALAADPSPDVQVALLVAIGLMRDKSSQAVTCVEAGLRSEDAQVLSTALMTFNQGLKVPLRFAHVWRKEKTTLLWSCRNGFAWDYLNGIGEAKPWRDQAWGGLDDLTKMSLLFRAGTRESVPLGIQVALSQTPPRFWMVAKAEPVDVPYLIELLKDSHPEIKGYATRALVDAKVPGTIESIQDFIYQYRAGIHNIPDSAISDLGIGQVLPQLNESSLYGILINNPKEWFWPVYCELIKRKTPMKYADLRGRGKTGPLFELSAVEPSLLRRCQLEALIREKVYEDLPDYFTLTLMDPRPASAFQDLAGPLLADKNFRETMPPAFVAACKAKVKDWLGRSPQNGGPPATNPNGADTARLLLLYFSEQPDWDAAWLKVRSSKNPLDEKVALEMVLWGRDQRSEALRRRLARYSSLPWFNKSLGYPVLGALRNSRPDKTMPGPCAGQVEFPISLPALPPKAGALQKTLIQTVAGSGVSDAKGFAIAFLAMRGALPDENDLLGTLHVLAAPSKTVRAQAYVLVAENPVYWNLGVPLNPGDEEAWIAANLDRLSALSLESAASPPSLTPEDSVWMDGVLKEARKTYFNKLVSNLQNPSPDGMSGFGGCRIVGGGYMPPTPTVSTPSDVFIREAGPEFEPEIRACLTSPEAKVRHAAALALWKMFRDPEALAVFKKDAEAGEPRQRAEALNLLQQFRRSESADLFPPLLGDRDPVLRQVGLVGVRNFAIKSSLPQVLTLVTDQDATVSALAVATLGEWRLPEARPLLLALVTEDGPLAPAAALALTHYRSPDDLDVLLQTAGDPRTSEKTCLRLLGVLSEVTLRAGPQPVGQGMSFGREQHLQPGTLDDWKTWWTKHRGEPAGARAKGVIEEQIRFLLSNPDEAKVGRITWTLKQRFPGLACLGYGAALLPQCRDLLLKWLNIHNGESPWDLFTSPESNPWENLGLLWEIDPKGAKRLLFTTFYHFAEGNFTNPWQSSSSNESFHDRLVRYANVDFGDPGPAKCGTKERILADWLAWAQKEGWAE